MADVQPLRALHYDLDRVGALEHVLAPPYDVIDPAQRAELAARSPYNIVHVDLPQADGGDPYERAAEILGAWRSEGALRRDPEPALWALTQAYHAPDGRSYERRAFLCRVRVEPYGPGRIRPHERTHPGPKEDRLRLTRATRANLSPIFSLYSDPEHAAWQALAPHVESAPWGEAVDDEGTRNRMWRVADPSAIAAVQAALRDSELLIADGHHRYETARVYAEERGGEGAHRYVLMCLVALEDPGLTVFPTHRMVHGLDGTRREALAAALERHFDIEPAPASALVPESGGGLRIGYLDRHRPEPALLTLRDPDAVREALAGRSEPYMQLDTAVLEALVLKGALGLDDERIAHLDGLGYARSAEEARALVQDGSYDAAFFMRGTPIEQIRAIAAEGENMPPKTTFFYPKIPTGLLVNPLED